MSSEARSCAGRIESELRSRIDDLSRLWNAYGEGIESRDDLGSIHDYGLCFDYIAPDTFDDQKEGDFHYQLSWGGASGEFRFYANPDFSCHRIEYWFLDWFDGAHRVLSDTDEARLSALWEWFRECRSMKLRKPKTDNRMQRRCFFVSGFSQHSALFE